MTEESNREAVGADGRRTVRDITLGNAAPADYAAADVGPVRDAADEALLAQLHAESAPERRRALLELATRDPASSAEAQIARLAVHDPDDQVRQFAVEALGKLDGHPAVARRLLEADPDPWVRAEAVVTLDRLARATHESTFRDLLDDDAPAVRRNALIALVKLHGEAAKAELLDAVEDPSDRVREWAVKLLGQYDDDPVVTETLEAVLDDAAEADVVTETAARALGARGADLDDLLEDETGTASADDHMLNRVPDP